MTRSLLAGALCALLAGPASAQHVSNEEMWRTFAAQLGPNAFVKVRLANGQSLRGHVIRAGDASVSINPKTRIAVPLRRLDYADIVSIERQKEPKWNPAAKVLMGVGVAVGTLYLIAIAALASGYD